MINNKVLLISKKKIYSAKIMLNYHNYKQPQVFFLANKIGGGKKFYTIPGGT